MVALTFTPSTIISEFQVDTYAYVLDITFIDTGAKLYTVWIEVRTLHRH